MEFEGAFFNTEDFKLTRTKLGEGGFGKVFIIQNIKDNRNYAVKIINTSQGFNGSKQMQLMRESMILRQLHHPCIVRFYGINFQSFSDPEKLEPSIITEYLPNGSLKDILDKEKSSLADDNWSPTKKYISLLGIASAMRYLHSNDIIHRDLKPQNILIDSYYYPRVCDFGLSRCINTNSTNISMTKEVGTLYMAPELLGGESHYDPSVDVYAFSILAYEIVTGKNPYFELGNLTPFKLANKVMQGYRPKFTNAITNKMKNLLTRCWSENISDRPTFDEIYNLLSNDFSYFDEDVDEDEIKQFIEDIENESKKATKNLQNKEKSKTNDNNLLTENLHTALVRLLGHEKDLNFDRAAHLLILESNKGNSLASYILGLLYEGGKGVSKNKDLAKTYYEVSANQGDSYGYNRIGNLYYDGYDSKPDYQKAFKFFQKSSNLGNHSGTNSVAFCYDLGKGVKQDSKKAFELYQKAIEQGSSIAINNLGCLYKYGDGVKKDLNKALELFKKAAEKGIPLAYRNIGDLYKEGLGVKTNLTKAFENYKKAADCGDENGYDKLGDCYKEGIGVNVNIEKAIECYQKAGDLGNASSYLAIGDIMYDKDFNKTFEYYKKAADLNYPLAYLKLGTLYSSGNGVKRDYNKAVELYRKAIDDGETLGYRLMGYMYKDGNGVEQNYSKAADCFKKAADECDDTYSMFELALLYNDGKGVPKDYEMAYNLMKKAADLGYDSAMLGTAICYEEGIGTKRNDLKAYEYYKKAADLGNEKAIEKLKHLKKPKIAKSLKKT